MTGPDRGNTSLKVLIVAPNVSSQFGGEAFLPLKYFQVLRRRGHPARLIAHARNRANLETVLGPDIAAVDFIEDSPAYLGVWALSRRMPDLLRRTLFGTLTNLMTEAAQARLIRRLLAEGAVELIHQPIPVSPKTPSSLYGFGIPVVIGPMNGGMTYPAGYEDHESVATRRTVAVARQVAVLLNRVVPGKRRATALLVANERTRAALPVRNHPNIVTLVENGVDLAVWAQPADRPERVQGAPLRLVFMGRLVAWKAVDITLEALRLARAEGADVTLDILGDGPERPTLEARARMLGVGGSVRFHGFRPQADCAGILRKSDALILNSLYECGGAVVLEAMGLGLPVIASDWGGPADYIDASSGILIPPVPRAGFANRLAEAILRIARDPGLGRLMGQAGRARIRDQFDWDKKMDRMLEIYRAALTTPPKR